MTFPTVTARNLLNERYTLPRDFRAAYNLAFIAFEQVHQYDVNTWLPFAKRMEATYPWVKAYELPTVGEMPLVNRLLVDMWMRQGIPDRATRKVTITLYIDVDDFLTAVDLPDASRIYTLLLDRQGTIHWRGVGPYTPALGTELESVLKGVPTS